MIIIRRRILIASCNIYSNFNRSNQAAVRIIFGYVLLLINFLFFVSIQAVYKIKFIIVINVIICIIFVKMLKFKQAASSTDPVSKISSLKRCLALVLFFIIVIIIFIIIVVISQIALL